MLFKKILIDSEIAPSFLDFNTLEHHQVYTQTSNILIAVSDCVRFKTLTDVKLDDIFMDITVYINHIRSVTDERMAFRVYQWTLRKLRFYEKYSNSLELYEYSNNLFKLYNKLKNPIKRRRRIEN